MSDDNFYIMINAHHAPLEFVFPIENWGKNWVRELDTGVGWTSKKRTFGEGERIKIAGRSLVVFRHAS